MAFQTYVKRGHLAAVKIVALCCLGGWQRRKMRIYDGSKIQYDLDCVEVVSVEKCPFCLTKAVEDDCVASQKWAHCSNCGAKHVHTLELNPWYWDFDLEWSLEELRNSTERNEMFDLEVEHLKLMLEGEKLSRENAELFLEMAKQKIASRNRIIKSLRAALREN
ncbi:MAG: hypothetical protein A2896_02745 [Candidatus Nealsonbacteria bacterium RIFCSPLOWO2_01_FULL_43_32]|uniref:Uncharacterized protein n=1 Tax=Candidatus Nealsonbacteria bacterium RIFCSPLOWO2_01_FULL_43_32 TaxID=1801672 RepID=A0A1G2EHC6_9BACT|nr:MAG: hypothetical protein A2896_02745 [Candidatus Nealsonbacteria bacterium RIFCSPLOWO2_01_FULL_43_32]